MVNKQLQAYKIFRQDKSLICPAFCCTCIFRLNPIE